MNRDRASFLHEIHKRERGQVLPIVVLSLVAIIGMTALVVDSAVAFYSYSELQASTNAAVLAGAEAMAQPGATLASITAAVTLYSGVAGNKNANTGLPGVTLVSGYSPRLYCSTTLQSTFGVQCVAPSSTNAIVVKQQVNLPLNFASVLGAGTITLTATATASMRGASQGPFNVVMLMDSTSSMNNIQSSTDCSTSAISCALSGVQTLLKNLSPCPSSQTTCGWINLVAGPPAYGWVSNSVNRVSLLTFPPVTVATAVRDFNCAGTTPAAVPYATPFPATSTYQIVGFSSDYRSSDTITTLDQSSYLVAAVGGKTGCTGLQAIGGDGTYYAQAIYQAQTYLAAEQTANPGSKNVLILLSDGDSNSTCSVAGSDPCTSPGTGPPSPMLGAWTKTSDPAYPNTKNQCHQAITAAQAAWAAGTTVYSVNFGAEAAGCSTDSPAISPCQTMLQIATYQALGTASTTYFSDDPSSGTDPACVAAARPTTSLNQIFQVIAGDLTVSKLIQNGTP